MNSINRLGLGSSRGAFATVGVVFFAATLAACSSDESSKANPDSGGSANESGGSANESGGSSNGSGGSVSSAGAGGSNVGGSNVGASNTGCTVTPPSAWSAPNWDTNAKDVLALRKQLGTLTGNTLMRGAETGAVTVDLASLNTAYETGTPSLKSITPTHLVGVIGDAFEEFVAAVGAGTQDLVGAGGNWEPGAQGGIWSTNTRAFNEGGIEIRMIVNMGLFGGALYSYALEQTVGAINEGTIDTLAAAFGANSALNPGRSNDAVEANQNTLSANYVYQMGFYARAKQALIAAKAYAVSDACTAERDTAIRTFFGAWEQGLFARFAFYSNTGAAGLAKATDDEAIAGGLHQQAEGLGLALGFYGVPTPSGGPMSTSARSMTDERIAQALGALGVNAKGDLGDATFGKFVSDPLGYANAVKDVEAVIADAFGLTKTDLESYRAPKDG
jgi:hypothetical protein